MQTRAHVQHTARWSVRQHYPAGSYHLKVVIFTTAVEGPSGVGTTVKVVRDAVPQAISNLHSSDGTSSSHCVLYNTAAFLLQERRWVRVGTWRPGAQQHPAALAFRRCGVQTPPPRTHTQS